MPSSHAMSRMAFIAEEKKDGDEHCYYEDSKEQRMAFIVEEKKDDGEELFYEDGSYCTYGPSHRYSLQRDPPLASTSFANDKDAFPAPETRKRPEPQGQRDIADADASLPRGPPTGNLAKRSPWLLLPCAAGITSCYLWYGVVQEHLFRMENAGEEREGSITLFFLAAGTFSSFLLAWLWTVVGPAFSPGESKSAIALDQRRKGGGGLDHPLLVATSLTYLCAMAASNESLRYVSYPTCVLAKSSKLIPTMVVGWAVDRWRVWRHRSGDDGNFDGKSINTMEWTGAAFITVGILSFQYIQLQKNISGDSHQDGTEVKGDSPYGLALLGLSLFMDGLLGACQSALKRKDGRASRPPSAMESMLFINLYATLVLLPASHYAGQFHRGVATVFHNSSDRKSALFFQLLLSASLGQVFIFLTIHYFSPLTCTTITTTRKFLTILCSVYKFGHALGFSSWVGIGLVFGGLYLQIAAKFLDRSGPHGRKEKTE